MTNRIGTESVSVLKALSLAVFCRIICKVYLLCLIPLQTKPALMSVGSILSKLLQQLHRDFC